MEIVGYIALILAAIIVVALLLLAIVSVSDIIRYFRIRRM